MNRKGMASPRSTFSLVFKNKSYLHYLNSDNPVKLKTFPTFFNLTAPPESHCVIVSFQNLLDA